MGKRIPKRSRYEKFSCLIANRVSSILELDSRLKLWLILFTETLIPPQIALILTVTPPSPNILTSKKIKMQKLKKKWSIKVRQMQIIFTEKFTKRENSKTWKVFHARKMGVGGGGERVTNKRCIHQTTTERLDLPNCNPLSDKILEKQFSLQHIHFFGISSSLSSSGH